MRPLLTSLFLVLACYRCAFALNPALDISQYAHTAWRIRDGFFKGRIVSIAQTPDGYLWLGTELGLVRFDGVRFVPWQPPAGQSLPSSYIRDLLAARDGTLWIGTVDGLASWKEGKLTTHPAFAGFGVLSLAEDRDDTIWISGVLIESGRLCAIRRGAVQCHGSDGVFGRWTSSLHVADDALWVAADTGLWQWTAQSPKRHSLADPLYSGPNSFAEADGEVLFAARSGVGHIVDGKALPLRPQGVSWPSPPTSLHRDRDGGVWIGTRSGILHLHQGRTDRFTRADGLSGDVVYHTFEDREGNIWVSTSDGLDRFREFAVATFSKAQGLSNSSAASILAAAGSLWINTGALDVWDQGSAARPIVGMPTRDVGSLFRDSRGRIWASAIGVAGVVENGGFRAVVEVPGDLVNAIDEDARGNVWLLTQKSGLFRLPPGREVERIAWSALGRADHAGRVAADHARGGLWLGFSRGGLSYYVDGKIRESYAVADGVGNGRVNYLSIDRDATVWAGTAGGLSRVKNGRAATLSSTNGLPCDAVDWMIADDVGSYWLYMQCGLTRVARSELQAWAAAIDAGQTPPAVRATLFDEADGVRSAASISSYSPHAAKTPDGRLWFIAPGGVSVVDPRRLPFNGVVPAVSIEQVSADRTAYDVASRASRTLQLPPLTRDLQIDYTALSLVAPEKMQFRYRLEGRDSDWHAVGTRRRAFYDRLPPGSYRFRVTASNNDRVWNEEGAAVDFVIAPAYYQTTWFLALSAGIVAAAIWGAHRVRLRIVQTHEREIIALNERLMKAQEQERIRIAGELHDGVMQEMLAVTMMLGTAKRRIIGDSAAQATIDKVQQKLIQVGTDIRQLSHDLHPPVLQDAGLPEALRAYCEQFSAGSGIPVSCDADDSLHDLSRGAALALFRIVQEALGNAAKHAAAKHMIVRLTRFNGLVSLTVSDDGAGFDASRLGTSGGLGLIMMRERAGQLNGKFEFESAPGRGTTIKVTIPFR